MPTIRKQSPAQATARHGNDSRQATGCSRCSRSPLSWGQLLWESRFLLSRRRLGQARAASGSGPPPLLTDLRGTGSLQQGTEGTGRGAELSRFAPRTGPRGIGAVKLGQSDDLHGPHPLPALRRIGRGGGIALLRPRLVAGEQWLAPGRETFPWGAYGFQGVPCAQTQHGPFLQLSGVPWRRHCHTAESNM